MTRKEADRLQESLERAAQGMSIDESLIPLVLTAQRVARLAEPPPPPPNQLLAGRRQFLTEAARMRDSQKPGRTTFPWWTARLRLAGTLLAGVLLFALVFGVGQTAAASLPGEPLYGLKLMAEAMRLELTSDPEAMSGLTIDLLEERLEEITTMLGQGQAVTEHTASRAGEQLALAVQATQQVEGAAATRAMQRLSATLQTGQQSMVHFLGSLPESEQGPVQRLLREMQRVRRELNRAQEAPSGEQNRQREGTPGTPPNLPGAPRQPGVGPGRGPQPMGTPLGPRATEDPGSGPGPQPTGSPAGPQPTRDPRFGPGPEPTASPAGPKPTEDPGSGPGRQPTASPAGPRPTGDPGTGPDPKSTASPAGPQPTEDPGSGPGPQSTSSSAGPQPTEDSGSGPGPQNTQEPGGGGGGGKP
jgi:hypothetical protein